MNNKYMDKNTHNWINKKNERNWWRKFKERKKVSMPQAHIEYELSWPRHQVQQFDYHLWKLLLACVQDIFVLAMCWFGTLFLVHYVFDNKVNSK